MIALLTSSEKAGSDALNSPSVTVITMPVVTPASAGVTSGCERIVTHVAGIPERTAVITHIPHPESGLFGIPHQAPTRAADWRAGGGFYVASLGKGHGAVSHMKSGLGVGGTDTYLGIRIQAAASDHKE